MENIKGLLEYARVYQHDVRAKQTKVCDAERAGFLTPSTRPATFEPTDNRTVQGRTAYIIPSMIR